MGHRLKAYSIQLVSLVIILGAMLGCQEMENAILLETHSVSNGTYRGLEVGATKRATIDGIRKLEALYIRPIPKEKFNITKANIKELKRINDVDGIRVTNYRGLSIDLCFKQNHVASIRLSVPAKDNNWFQEGEA